MYTNWSVLMTALTSEKRHDCFSFFFIILKPLQLNDSKKKKTAELEKKKVVAVS